MGVINPIRYTQGREPAERQAPLSIQFLGNRFFVTASTSEPTAAGVTVQTSARWRSPLRASSRSDPNAFRRGVG